MMEVTLDDSKTNVENVEKAVAEVGHDTNKFKATDEAYNDLPSCYLYDRTKENQKEKE